MIFDSDRAGHVGIVRDRLIGDPGVRVVPVSGADVFIVRDFVTEMECAHFNALIDADRRPSGLMAPHDDPDFRTSETSFLRAKDAFVSAVGDRIDALLGLPSEYGEPLQGQRYAPGQQFKPHHDFFHEAQSYWPPERERGGQRTWTAMANLNLPEAGGKTFFPVLGLRISPRLGNLIVWANLDAEGRPNPRTLHQGEPVVAGTKYVLTKWYRERPWHAAACPAPVPVPIAAAAA